MAVADFTDDNLDTMMPVFNSYCSFLTRLLQPDTTTMILPTCFLDNVGCIETLLLAVSNKKCHELRLLKLTLFSFNDVEYDEDKHPHDLLHRKFFQSLPPLSNLQVLDFDTEVCLEDAELQQLALAAPNLV